MGNCRREEKDLGQLMKSITENQLHEVKEAHIADKEKGKDKSILKSNWASNSIRKKREALIRRGVTCKKIPL